MKKYIAIYTDKYDLFVSQAEFKCNNLKEAKSYAQFHKQMTPEIKKRGRVKTNVRLKK